MKCVLCKRGKTQKGQTTITLERKGVTLVFKKVPAQVCENCRETYVDELISSRLLETANDVSRSGVQVDIREYKAA